MSSRLRKDKKMDIKKNLTKINKNKLTSNTQKVAVQLLTAEGDWISRRQLSRRIPSTAARIRDLRKDKFGGFSVECKSAQQLKRNAAKGTFYYRVRPNTVTKKQFNKVFRI